MKSINLDKKRVVQYGIGMLYVRSLLFFSFVYAPDLNQAVSFDTVFPANQFANVLSICMQAFGDIQLLQQAALPDHEPVGMQRDMYDLFYGRVSRLQAAVAMMLHDEQPEVLDDVEYLVGVLDQMARTLAELVKTHRHETSHVSLQALHILTNCKRELEDMLDKVA